MRVTSFLFLILSTIALPAAEEKEPAIPKGARDLVIDLTNILRERDIGRIYRLPLFVSQEVYVALMKDEYHESTLNRNWWLSEKEFAADCSRAMDQFPQVGSKGIGIVEIDLTNVVSEQKNGMEVIRNVKVVCRYGYRLGRFSFVSPPIIKTTDGWRFFDRFERLVRIELPSMDGE